jgi:hypothetical protein
MSSSGMLRRVALVRTDVSEELSASFFRVTRVGELGTTLTASSNRRRRHSSLTVGVWRSVRITVFGTYQGASTVLPETSDWNRSMVSIFQVEAVPHNCIA